RALGIFDPLRANAIGYVDFAVSDGGARVAFADRRAPADFRAAWRELREDACLAPDAVPLGSEPLRPIVGPGGGCEDPAQEERQGPSCRHSFSPVTSNLFSPASQTRERRSLGIYFLSL